MNRPTNPVDQCPSCHMQSVGNVCGSRKRRINQTESGEFFKTIDCTLWIERMIEKNESGTKVCPTCGQIILERVISVLTQPSNPPDTPTGITRIVKEEEFRQGLQDKINETFPDPIVFDWGASQLEINNVPTIQEQLSGGINNLVDAVKLPEKKQKRRGFKDMPKAKYGSGRRKNAEVL